MTAPILPFQPSLRPSLPTVEGNVDYRKFRDKLLRIDQILISGPEQKFVAAATEQWIAQSQSAHEKIPASMQQRYQTHSRQALRCNILRPSLQEGYRDFAAHLADSPLLQRFCLLDQIDLIKVPAKSSLQRYAHWVDQKTLQQTIHQILRQAHQQPEKLQLEQAVDLEACFLDNTCLQDYLFFASGR